MWGGSGGSMKSREQLVGCGYVCEEISGCKCDCIRRSSDGKD